MQLLRVVMIIPMTINKVLNTSSELKEKVFAILKLRHSTWVLLYRFYNSYKGKQCYIHEENFTMEVTSSIMFCLE